MPDSYGNLKVVGHRPWAAFWKRSICVFMGTHTTLLFQFICFYIRSIFFLERGSSCVAWNELEFILQLLGWQACATIAVTFKRIKDVLRAGEMGLVGKGIRHKA